MLSAAVAILVAEDEGFTIGALDHGRILFMSAYLDGAQ